jgi:hypothetical protein
VGVEMGSHVYGWRTRNLVWNIDFQIIPILALTLSFVIVDLCEMNTKLTPTGVNAHTKYTVICQNKRVDDHWLSVLFLS